MRKDTKAPSSLPSDYRRGLHESHYAELHCDERLSNPQPQKLLLILLNTDSGPEWNGRIEARRGSDNKDVSWVLLGAQR